MPWDLILPIVGFCLIMLITILGTILPSKKKIYKIFIILMGLTACVLFARQEYRAFEIRRQELEYKYAISLDVIYYNKRLEIYNSGKTNLFFYGSQFNGWPREMGEPFIISPEMPYYHLTDLFENELVRIFGRNWRGSRTFTVFIKDTIQREHTAKFVFRITITDGQVTIGVQNSSILRSNWSK